MLYAKVNQYLGGGGMPFLTLKHKPKEDIGKYQDITLMASEILP